MRTLTVATASHLWASQPKAGWYKVFYLTYSACKNLLSGGVTSLSFAESLLACFTHLFPMFVLFCC